MIEDVIKLSEQLDKKLPADLVAFIKEAGDFARQNGYRLYLVGGVVRDLFLCRQNLDLDLVVEGDAVKLAQQVAPLYAKIKMSQFNTAKLQWGDWTADITTARSEKYARPGALPTIQPGSLKEDLARRDFTINALAIDLNPDEFGSVIDLYKGREDIKNRLIRILHEKSFTDDATRIWRAIRYEQRLDFRIEENTLKLLKRDVPMLETISGDRLRHELELVLKEENPEKAISRAAGLGVLSNLHPSLKDNGWLTKNFEEARRRTPKQPPVALYLALLIYHLNKDELEALLKKLNFSKTISQVLRDALGLKSELARLDKPDIKLSAIYNLLQPYSEHAIMANLIASDSATVRRNLELYLNELCYVKPILTGEDLIKMGVPAGPRVKEVLQRLLEARLDRDVSSKEDEEKLVKGCIPSG